jgi:hypothetical protein
MVAAVSEVAEKTVVQEWVNRLTELGIGIPNFKMQVPCLAPVVELVGFLMDGDRARKLIVQIDELVQGLDMYDEISIDIPVVKALVAVDELERAEEAAKRLSLSSARADVLSVLAARFKPERARILVTEIVRISDWTVPLTAPVWHDPEVIEAIKEELAVIRNG